MRLFLIGWDGKDTGLVEVAHRLKEMSHEILYWTYFDSASVDRASFPTTIFHNGLDALAGKPAGEMDVSDFVPPGENVLNEFQETELTVLTMMNKKYIGVQMEERKHLYYRFLGYWQGVLGVLKPDAIVYSFTPHTVYDYVIYSLAKKMGIKTVLFQPVLLTSGWNMVFSDYKKGSVALIDQIKRTADRQFSLADLKPETRAHYQKHVEVGEDVPPLYMQQTLSLYSGLRLISVKLRSLWTSLTVHKDFSIFATVLLYLPRKFKNNLKKEYFRVQSEADLGEKFIYTALQYQPEAQSCPQSGIFADQLLMIETLSAALPDGWFVYVKEHPVLWLLHGLKFYDARYKGYYEAIAQLKNVKVIPIETSSFRLIRHSQAVATGAGSVGWEAILRSKPVLAFGYPWYQECEGVCRVTNVASCREALRKIKNGFKISQQKVINFLACLDTVSVEVFFERYTAEISKIGPKQNAQNITKAIETELHKKEL